MCVIIAKGKGIKLPSKETLERCWNSNIDGAGFSVSDEESDKIQIYKGFMNFESFYESLCMFGKEDAIVMHFRRTTQGKSCPELTHPFPLSDNLSDMHNLSFTTDCAFCHNGDIPITGTDKYKEIYPNESDTSLFITRFVSNIFAHPSDLNDPIKLELLKFLIGPESKLAIHTPNGIKIVGMFDEIDGLYYSNFTNCKIFNAFTEI